MSQTFTQPAPGRQAEPVEESGYREGEVNEERTAIVVAEQIHKTFRNGEIEVHALRGVDLDDRDRRNGGDHGAVRLRQDGLC